MNAADKSMRWRAFVAFLVLLTAARLLAQSAPSTQAVRTVADAAADARRWVARPASEQSLDAFAPAADIRQRVYQEPRPLRVWVARVDLAAPGVRFAVTEPAEFSGADARFETRCATTLDFALQRGVQLAINTSAFTPFRQQMGEPMDVVGLAATSGQRYSDPDERFGAVYITRDGHVSLKGPPLPADDLWHVIPGFALLLDDRRIVVREDAANSKFGDVNPRTAVGVDPDGRTLWIVVADGRQPGVSEGITLVELACLFESLGAWDALNLDGGGSTTLVLEDSAGGYQVVNTPVGRGPPNTLRQVACNLGLYLPGRGLPPEDRGTDPASAGRVPSSLRLTLIHTIAGRRGGGYALKGGGVARDIAYDGEVVLRASGEGTYCCGATLEAFLDAYCRVKHGCAAADATGCWFENWPRDRFVALQRGWFGTEDAPTNPLLPEEIRPTIREKQVYHVLQWAGMARPVEHYRLLRRGDFVQFWRRSRPTPPAGGSPGPPTPTLRPDASASGPATGDRPIAGREPHQTADPQTPRAERPPTAADAASGHSVIFWARDYDTDGRERLWYWSSQKQPRYAYPLQPGGQPVTTPGYGINWEYIGEEIDPQRIYGVTLIEPGQELKAGAGGP